MTMHLTIWSNVLGGALILAYALVGLFFLKFWARTRDRLFALFALAFWVLMAERILLVGANLSGERLPYVYSVRLLAFLIIILAIVDKNRSRER